VGTGLSVLVLTKHQDRRLRYVVIAGLGTLNGYTIIDYKTPWCIIVIVWPFLLQFGHWLVRAWHEIDRMTIGLFTSIILAGSLQISLLLNFRNYTDEEEPYVYVQTLPDINKLLDPVRALASISPAYYHIRGNVLLPESDSHPLPWLLADFPQVSFLEDSNPPEEVDADFILVEDAYVAVVEERLKGRYFKDEIILRGGWGNSATLYLSVGTFGPLMAGRAADFPSAPTAAPSEQAAPQE
jgi:hypothetical protein